MAVIASVLAPVNVSGAPELETPLIVMMQGGSPNANAVVRSFTANGNGMWVHSLSNSGLRSLTIDIRDVSGPEPLSIMHLKVRFAAYDAYPMGRVELPGTIVVKDRPYEITLIPNGPKGTYCTYECSAPGVPPLAAFTATVEYRTVTVDASASRDPDGLITNYEWHWGDGSTDSGITATHQYADEVSSVEITLVVTDNDGYVASVTQSLQLPPVGLPTAAFTYSINGLHLWVDGSNSYDSMGTIISYVWDWGDGSLVDSGAVAMHDYAEVGLYTVVLTVMDNDGYTDSAETTIKTSLPPVSVMTWAADGFHVEVDGSASYDPDGLVAEYRWIWGDGSPDDFGPTTTHDYPMTGLYYLMLRITDNEGMRGGAATMLSLPFVAGKPIAKISYTKDSTGRVVTADASESYDPDGAITTYQWDWGDGTPFGSGIIATHDYGSTWPQWISLVVTDDDGLTDFEEAHIFSLVEELDVLVWGNTYGPDGSLVTGCFVTVTDLRTGEFLSFYDSEGQGVYWVDFAWNGPPYLHSGDTVQISAVNLRDNLSASAMATVESIGFGIINADLYFV